MDSSLRQTLKDNAIAFFHTYQDASLANDPSLISRGLSSTCVRQFQPPSFCHAMGYPANTDVPNAVYQARIAEGMQAWTATETKILHLTIDTEARRVAAQTAILGKWKSTTTQGEEEDAKLDFAWFLEFGEDGREVVRIVEYMDSPPVKEYYAKIQAILAAKGNTTD